MKYFTSDQFESIAQKIQGTDEEIQDRQQQNQSYDDSNYGDGFRSWLLYVICKIYVRHNQTMCSKNLRDKKDAYRP